MNSSLSGLLVHRAKPQVEARAVKEAARGQFSPAMKRYNRMFLRLVALGFTNLQIGKQIGLAEATVKVYMSGMRPKYPRGLMVAVALRMGLVTIDDLMARLREYEAQEGIEPDRDKEISI